MTLKFDLILGKMRESDGVAVLPVTALGTSGVQTINRSTSDKWTLTPSGAVTINFSNFTVSQEVIILITNGGTNVSWDSSIRWGIALSTPPTLLSDGIDVIRIIKTGTDSYLGEHVGAYSDVIPTSYDNTGGTGDRTSIITVTTNTNYNDPLSTLVDGNLSTPAGEWSGTAIGAYLRFEFASAKIINEMKFYMSGAMATGTWKIQGSNNATEWTDIGGTFTITDQITTITTISANETAYKYYQMIGTAGTLGTTHYETEMEFKISE